MALITCPECGQQVSSLAEKCPHCGSPVNIATIPVSEDSTTTTHVNKKKWPVWKWIVAVAGGIICLIGLFFTVVVVVALVGGYDENGNTAIEQAVTEIAAEEIPVEETCTEELALANEELSLSSFEHRINGTYWVSRDGFRKFHFDNGSVGESHQDVSGSYWIESSYTYSVNESYNDFVIEYGSGSDKTKIIFSKDLNSARYVTCNGMMGSSIDQE